MTSGSAVPRTWQRDSSGVLEGGDPGGDAQAGESWSSRWKLPGARGSLITVHAYPVHARDGYAVQVQAEFLVCADPSDPGSTEEWSDCVFDVLPGAYRRLQSAEAAARHAAGELPSGAGDWDGHSRQVPSSFTRGNKTRRAAVAACPGTQPAPGGPAGRARDQEDEG